MALVGTISGSNGTSISAVTGSLIISNNDASTFPSKQSDVILYVSGVAGGRGTTNAGVSLFGGDLVTSGNSYFVGNIAADGGNITTTASTFNLVNTTATTLNIGGAATSISIGSAGATITFNGDLAVNGGDITTTAGTANVFNATAATVNIAGGATAATNIGNASGLTTIAGDLKVAGNDISGSSGLNITLGASGKVTVAGDIAVEGGNVTTTAGTFNLANTNATSMNIGGAATSISIGAGGGTTTFPGDIAVNGGDITTTATTFNIAAGATSATNIGNASGLTTIAGNLKVAGNQISGSAGGNITLGAAGLVTVEGNLTTVGDVAVNGADITTSAATFNLINVTPTTVNFAGNATSLTMGAAAGTITTIRGGTLLGNTLTQDVFNTNATTVNFAGGATAATNIGNASGLTTIAGNLRVNTNQISGSAGGNITLGSAGAISVVGDLTASGDIAILGGDITTNQPTFNLLQSATTLNVGGINTTSSFGGAAEFGLVLEKMNTSGSSSGATTFNLQSQEVFFQKAPTGNITANFTNVPTTANRVTTPTIIVSQSSPAYTINAAQIAGSAVTINWPNAIPPNGNPNKYDVFGFSLIRSGSSWIVLGQMTSYG